MKLSTAIRIGSMTTKQITVYLRDSGNGRCALGAALDAAGHKFTDVVSAYLALETLFPILSGPIRDGLSPTMAIAMMNDHQHMSREAIADVVEGWEAEEADGYITTGVTESKPLELIAQESK